MSSYRVIGLMSGTSLDGLDIAFCEFTGSWDENWRYKIIKSETIKYPKSLVEKLNNAQHLMAYDLALLDVELGFYFGNKVKKFIKKNNLKSLDFISSHGHTVFHRPEKSLTFQIGSGAHLSALTNLPVICDFRRKDVALGGQGAPLVPIGDASLFGGFQFCINLGGIANISYAQKSKSIAFDICPVNMVLNSLANKNGLAFDKNGNLAATGKIIPELLIQLNRLTFYKKKHPKSLGKEWVEEVFFPVLKKFNDYSLKDIMNTVCEHIALQIKNTLISSNQKGNKVLLTGGGVFNKFLISRVKYHCIDFIIEIPSSKIINFKEALIFAFLGVLRWEKKINCLKSVTGASKDNVGGAIYY